MPFNEEEDKLYRQLEQVLATRYRQLWYKLRLLDEQGGYPPLKLDFLFEDLIQLVSFLFSDHGNKQGSVYGMRLSSEAGFNLTNEDVQSKLSDGAIRYGKDVHEMRIEILRWGQSGGSEDQLGHNGIDRYTVGEYTFSTRLDECLVFKLPSIIKCSDHEMFLSKGWASVLMHMRILVGCILGHDFDIDCVHQHTTNILRKYGDLCILKRRRRHMKADDDTQTDDDTNYHNTFSFVKQKGHSTFTAVARKALYLLITKIDNPKVPATYQVRMHDLFV
jgi:hypothetical protein